MRDAREENASDIFEGTRNLQNRPRDQLFDRGADDVDEDASGSEVTRGTFYSHRTFYLALLKVSGGRYVAAHI